MWMRSSPEGDRKALWSPPQRRNPCNKKDQQQENHFSRCWSVAPIWRDNVRVVGKASWGRICGCAKLLAGTLRCLHLCWARLAKWSPEEQLGRCPKPHKGRCPLTPPKGLRPSGLPFARLSWLLLHALPACLSFWRCDLVLFPFPFNPHESLSSPRAQSRVSSVHPPSSQYNPTQIY